MTEKLLIPNVKTSQVVECISPKEKGAKIFFINKKLGEQGESAEISQDRTIIYLDTVNHKGNTYEVWIKQPYVGSIPVVYDEVELYSSILDTAIAEMINSRVNKKYASIRVTGTLYEKHGEILGYGTQDINRHEFTTSDNLIKKLRALGLNDADIEDIQGVIAKSDNSLCVRELIKFEAKNLSNPNIVTHEDFYGLCAGCDFSNHSEAQAYTHMSEEQKAKLPGSTAYIYSHWWSCSRCTDLLEQLGIAKIIVSKKWTWDYLEIDKALESNL